MIAQSFIHWAHLDENGLAVSIPFLTLALVLAAVSIREYITERKSK